MDQRSRARGQALRRLGGRLIDRLMGEPAGEYARTLGWVMPPPPPRAPADTDAALDAIAAGVTARVRALGDAPRADLFARLGGDAKTERRAVGTIFLPAARAATLDADADPAVALAAHDFLVAWLVQSPPRPSRDELANVARRRVYEGLLDIGDADLVAAARTAAAAYAR